MRSFLRSLFVHTLYWTGATAWARRQLVRDRAVIVLLFHRVLTADEMTKTNCLRGIIVSDSTFAGIMGYVKRHCEVLDLSGGDPGWKGDSFKPRCAVTFDDGWIDNAGTAFRIAQEYGVPITIFICPGLVGLKNPFWPEHVIGLLRQSEQFDRKGAPPDFLGLTAIGRRWKQLSGLFEDRLETLVEYLKELAPEERRRQVAEFERHFDSVGIGETTVDAILAWDDVHRLRSAGVTFGLHSQTHQILTRISAAEVQKELEGSKQRLETALGGECNLFAYPNGGWSDEVRRQVQAAGYAAAFTTQAVPWTAESDPFLIPRVNMWEGDAVGASGRFSRPMLEYTLFWKPWRQLRKSSLQASTVSQTGVSQAVL
jgi:peptidoglycan/xylan/chitin deacetylase (PgdA/CDA1 family)